VSALLNLSSSDARCFGVPGTALGAALLLSTLGGCWRGKPRALPEGDPGRPDIILISIDTLRADHLQSYGHHRKTSPWFDQLAADGTRFAFARSSSPWTLPSHTTMLSGQLPKTHMVVEDKHVLPESTPVLPELLQEAGYKTAGFVATLYVSRMFNFDRGFDRFSDFDIDSEKQNLRGEVLAENVVDEALRWWGEQPAGQPVFLFLHSYDVHYEYDPPGDYGTLFDRAPESSDRKYKNYHHFKKHKVSEEQFEHQRAQYDESIRYVDDQFKRLADAAKAAGRDVRFVITADHGEEFGERGSWGHAHTLYAEQLHVPLIISGPGIPKGIVNGAVGTQDVAPTIAGWVDGTPDFGVLDGIDLAGMMAGAESPRRGFSAETTRFKTNRLAYYADGLRLEWDLKGNKAELFDPHADPKEANDLAASRPDDVLKLQKALAADLGTPWKATMAGKIETKGRILKDGKRLKMLRVQPGDEFQVLPYDAGVFMTVEGTRYGPWKSIGGDRPGEGCPLRFSGGGATGSVAMDDGDLALLETLGYITEDEGNDTEPAGAPCGK
jgi:arylsulfatase